MRSFHIVLLVAALAGASLAVAAPKPTYKPAYVPQAQYCFPQAAVPPGHSPLCDVIPGDISPDPMLAGQKNGYKGIIGPLPANPAADVETPFDNYSWQIFVALNWKYSSDRSVHIPAKTGLDGKTGPRVWENWARVADIYGNSPVQASCDVPTGYELFSMGSDGHGTPSTHNEEYIQAATLKPAIDVNGNYTLYERRLNEVEVAYLKQPVPDQPTWNLTTVAGQQAFVNGGGTVDFPATGASQNGAIEIKAAWRMLDPKRHAENVKKYYVVRAIVAVAPDLVDHGPQTIVAPICAKVDLGLVGLHIMQKNVDSHNQLLPEWFWTTFEHVDNVPLADKACDVTEPGSCGMLNQTACPSSAKARYDYFNPRVSKATTNYSVTLPNNESYHWNGNVPYGKAYLQPGFGKNVVGSQITRCWQIYKLTQEINKQWQGKLRALGSVFANYMLVGTQWGASLEPSFPPEGPSDAAPNYLSNTLLETYLQTFWNAQNPTPFSTGSCVSCHAAATLVPTNSQGESVSANFSFLPGEAVPTLTRTIPPLPSTTAPRAKKK